jgi:hypothetical protein
VGSDAAIAPDFDELNSEDGAQDTRAGSPNLSPQCPNLTDLRYYRAAA